MQQLYTEVCSEQNQPINPFIAEILSQTEEQELYTSTLKLCGNNRLVQVQRVSDEDFLVLAQVLSKNSFITNLDLRYNRVTDNGAAHIATFLQVSILFLSSDKFYFIFLKIFNKTNEHGLFCTESLIFYHNLIY
eukprot:XP_017949879.1 PREDICTED: leucine-rich repeat-containing protein 34 isoform X2 [Xenopus tropicalis]